MRLRILVCVAFTLCASDIASAGLDWPPRKKDIKRTEKLLRKYFIAEKVAQLARKKTGDQTLTVALKNINGFDATFENKSKDSFFIVESTFLLKDGIVTEQQQPTAQKELVEAIKNMTDSCTRCKPSFKKIDGTENTYQSAIICSTKIDISTPESKALVRNIKKQAADELLRKQR